MCSQGGGKVTPINGQKHACHLCNHEYAIMKIEQLQKQKQELVELVHDALSCNPNYTDQVTAIMEKLKAIRGEG